MGRGTLEVVGVREVRRECSPEGELADVGKLKGNAGLYGVVVIEYDAGGMVIVGGIGVRLRKTFCRGDGDILREHKEGREAEWCMLLSGLDGKCCAGG